jgi:hypothetical protein
MRLLFISCISHSGMALAPLINHGEWGNPPLKMGNARELSFYFSLYERGRWDGMELFHRLPRLHKVFSASFL